MHTEKLGGPAEKYKVSTCAPPALTGADIQACVALIEGGEAVGRQFIAAGLPKALVLVLVRAGNRIVGVGAIKRVRPAYAKKIATQSGFEFDPAAPELGYVAVDPAYRNRGLSGRIVGALLAVQKGLLFATTGNDHMKSSLRKAGFGPKGREWQGQRGPLSLWIREA